MKILFSIFLIFNLIFSSYAHASTIAYDTKMRVGSTWKTARTIIRNNPLGKNPQGLILAVGTIYVGDKVITEYQNGTFDAPMQSMKNAVAEMYVAGVKASGWLKEQFDALKKEFICDSNGNCTAAAKQSDRTFKDTKFALKNSTQFFDSISKAVSTSSYATSSNYNGYQIESIAWGSKSLSDAMNSINRTGELTITLSISCLAAIYCGNNQTLRDTRTLFIAFEKTIAEPKPETTSRPVALPSDIAKSVAEPDTEPKQAEIVGNCFITNCQSIPTKKNPSSPTPPAYFPNGYPVAPLEYPLPPLTGNADGTYTDSAGNQVGEGTGEAPSEGVKPDSMGAFCTWAKSVCDLKDWFTADNIPDPEQHQIQDFDSSKAPKAKVWSVGDRQCPTSPNIDIPFINQSITLNINPLCDFLASIRSFVIASAYLGAAFIIFNYRIS
jgi:hypothetical protein